MTSRRIRAVWSLGLCPMLMLMGFDICLVSASGYISNTGEVHISQQDQANEIAKRRLGCESLIQSAKTVSSYSSPTMSPSSQPCNTTFDGILCWPETFPGTIRFLPCPNYIQGFITTGNASKTCMPDGTWFENPKNNMTWTDYRPCYNQRSGSVVPELFTTHVEYIQLMYNTGYGVSFISLLLAVIIMLHFRKLHCPRNTVHVNMFISFILRAIISFLKDLLLVQGLGFSFDVEETPTDTVLFINNGTHWECKLLYTLFHYVLSANYMWILVEGLYLHTLVYVSVFSERGSIKWYFLLGWGTPLLSLIPWVVVRILYEDIFCWNTNPTVGFFWILKTPIVISLVVNFMFFINILRALFTKLHKPNTASARRNRYKRLGKATLILIPLFGVHYIVFLWVPDSVAPTAEVVKLYFEMFFNSFQGFLVAVLFCFLNQEVQMEIKKSWYRFWSKPDPVYLQQSQHLGESGSQRRSRKEVSDHVSSDRSSDHDSCLCKWTLDKDGRLRRTFIKTTVVKAPKPPKKLFLSIKESKM